MKVRIDFDALVKKDGGKELRDGVADVLRDLHIAGIFLGLITGEKDMASAGAFLKEKGIRRYFSEIVSFESFERDECGYADYYVDALLAERAGWENLKKTRSAIPLL